MKPNELRIGNYVYQSDAYGDMPMTSYQIYQFDTFCRGGIVADYYKGIKPIPLTEEWLLKFGFEKHNETGTVYYSTRIGVLYIYRMLTGKNAGRYFFERKYDDQFIEYVHQLQNLYFALTGEELTIKNTTK